MVVLLNNAEGGSNTTAVTAGNSGGASGDAFSSIVLGTNNPLTFSSTQHAHGALSYKFASTTTPTETYAVMSGVSTVTWFGRFYIFIETLPTSGSFIIFRMFNGATAQASMRMASTGKLGAYNSVGSVYTGMTSTTTFVVNKWYRVEWEVVGSSTVGQFIYSVYDPFDSSTPLETKDTGAAVNTVGATDRFRIGNAGAPTASTTFYLDDLGFSDAGFLGPVSKSLIFSGRARSNSIRLR